MNTGESSEAIRQVRKLGKGAHGEKKTNPELGVIGPYFRTKKVPNR